MAKPPKTSMSASQVAAGTRAASRGNGATAANKALKTLSRAESIGARAGRTVGGPLGGLAGRVVGAAAGRAAMNSGKKRK